MYHIDKKVGIAGEECVGATCVRVAEMDPLVQNMIDSGVIKPEEIGPHTVLTSSLSVPDEPIEADSDRFAGDTDWRGGAGPAGGATEVGRTFATVQIVPEMSQRSKLALGTALGHLLNGNDDQMWETLLDLSEEDVVAAHHALGKLLMQVLSHGASFQLKRSFEEELRNK